MKDLLTRPLCRILAGLSVALPFLGCATIAEKVADHMAVKSLQHQHDVVLFEGDLAAFRSCLHHRGGTCTGNAVTALAGTLTATGAAATPATTTPPARAAVSLPVAASVDQLPAGHPAQLARSVLDHPALAHSVDLHNHLRGLGSGSLETENASGNACDRIHLPVSVSQVQDLHDRVHRATAAGGWHALQKHTEALLAASKRGHPGHEEKARDARKAHFLKTYIDAFFGNGHFIGIDFKVDAATATADIARELVRHTPLACQVYNAQSANGAGASGGNGGSGTASVPDCSTLAQSIYQSVANTSGNVDHKLLKVAQTGFVSRDGSFSAQVPSVAIDIDPVATHLVTFKASPDTPNGKFDWTALGTDLVRVVLEAVFDAHEGLPAVSNATAVRSNATAASLLPAMPQTMNAHLDPMKRMNDTAEVTSGILIDRIIQGIGPLSLNNRALENLTTTLVTTSVRKAAEKASWCWYSCGLDQDVKNLEADAKADVKAEAKKLEEATKRDVLRAGQRVCLRLHVQE